MRVVFVLDKFTEDVIGGAELSIQAHIDTCPFPYTRIRSKELRLRHLRNDDLIVFGNYFEMPVSMLAEFKDYRYVIEECDYKYCRFRSSHLHKLNTMKDCDCPQTYSAPIISFMAKAKALFWKSEGQRNIYYSLFPELKSIPSDIMGGVYTDDQIEYILSHRGVPHDEYYYVLKSNRWIKGYRESVAYCVKHRLPYRESKDLPWSEAIAEMAKSKGIVYMPSGYDVSCRMITEMKLMGKEIITNDNIQHTKESWFNGGEEKMVEFLKSRNKVFWERIHGILA